MAGLSEQAALFGPRKSLVGIVAHDPSRAVAGSPAIVILNAGIIHRVGPNRMFVSLARALAAHGHLVVRFDLSGVGDSAPREGALPPLEAALADIREIIDSLVHTRKVQRVVLIGLCSGADQSIVYCGQDPRVSGVILIDPSVPRTRGYYIRHFRSRMFRLRSWINFASGRHPVWNVFKPRARVPVVESNDPEHPRVRTFLEKAYRDALAAGVEIMAIFTAGRESQHNHPQQLLEAFPTVPFGARLRLEYFRQTDHTFTFEDDREVLARHILSWTARHAGGLEIAASGEDEARRASVS